MVHYKRLVFIGLIFTGSFFLRPSGACAQPADTVVQSALWHAQQGRVVVLPGFFSGNIPELAYRKSVLPGPQLVISDDPEYIRDAEGLALREKVQPGTVRLYAYNVNGVTQPAKMPRKITALLKNTGNGAMHLRFEKFSSQLPSENYYQIGKQGLADYFASKGSDSVRTIQPGEVVPVDPGRERQVVQYDELVHGFYEFTIDQPGEVSIVQTSPDTYGPVALDRIHSVIPTSHANAGRGLFEVCNYEVVPEKVLDTREGPVALVVADGKRDPWITGKEGNTKQVMVLSGNYGVVYTIEVKWKSSDGKGLALVTWNPWTHSGQWCGGMANTMVVSEGKYRGGIIQLPSDQLTTKGAPEAILVQVFLPSPGKKEQTIKLVYSPPGASCIPTPLVFIPISVTQKN